MSGLTTRDSAQLQPIASIGRTRDILTDSPTLAPPPPTAAFRWWTTRPPAMPPALPRTHTNLLVQPAPHVFSCIDGDEPEPPPARRASARSVPAPSARTKQRANRMTGLVTRDSAQLRPIASIGRTRGLTYTTAPPLASASRRCLSDACVDSRSPELVILECVAVEAQCHAVLRHRPLHMLRQAWS